MRVVVDIQRAAETDGPDDADIQSWAEAALQGQADEAELTVRIVDEAESAELNQRYRHKEGPTNVLSFPFEAPTAMPAESALNLLGDLVICAPVVERQAGEQHKSSRAHWAHMVVHGVLHLLGYDHIEAAAAHEMETLEIKILGVLGFPNPYEGAA